ncbi:MAG: AAA family ATPase [Candidatus Methanomethylophilaceae archaeon]|nr:AAA family ATPase [Candidatus Methanomethylophilaceae archaeon]MDD3379249.1 AAA family ATPase [Candidatus Methanomethylophilaceae archaeon]MDY0224589.1 AAA family ATPase [Candidatus Methanomethylophilaceae archaeon]
MRITISGPPGSGKTTACKNISEKLGFKAIVFGQIFRELAVDRNMTLREFSSLAEKDPSIDKMIDSKILEAARANSDIILESRLSAYMLSKNNIPALKIYLDASPSVRMARVGLREGETLENACKDTLARQASEAKRYKMYYDIDIEDKSVYDVIILTDDITPDEVVDTILEAVGVSTC